MKKHPSYLYAKQVVGHKVKAPEYVIKQCQDFLKTADGKNDKYVIDKSKVNIIDGLLKLLIMPKGLKAGESVYNCTVGYQWLFYVAVLCTVYRENTDHRRYETALLEICRKNFKTYTVGITFILLLLTEPKFSKFYSVAPDGSLSKEVKDAIMDTLKSSPLIYEYHEVKRFKILRDSIECLLTESKFIPLSYSTNRMDGKLPNVYLADEVGALPNSYPIEAMRSGQLNILNKLGCIVSTKYPTADNPFEDEVAMAKKILDGIVDDETTFALLYEPDDKKNWTTNDDILAHGNPAALEIPTIWEDLLKKRARAIEMESARENFLTKHCNIIYQGAGTETFIPIDKVQACKVDKIDWNGKDVYLGVDLAMTNDNCTVAMSAEVDGVIYSESIAFIPEGRIDEKNKFEHIDYRRFISAGKCIACGDLTVDYSVIEEFVFNIEKKYGVNVMAIGYDRYNALSSAQKWERGMMIDGKDTSFTTVEIKQHSSVLHPPTKFLTEKVFSKEWHYTENKLLEINFENARCRYDTNMNRYVDKKHSNGKVDMVVAIINSIYLLQQDVIFNDNFVVQVI